MKSLHALVYDIDKANRAGETSVSDAQEEAMYGNRTLYQHWDPGGQSSYNPDREQRQKLKREQSEKKYERREKERKQKESLFLLLIVVGIPLWIAGAVWGAKGVIIGLGAIAVIAIMFYALSYLPPSDDD